MCLPTRLLLVYLDMALGRCPLLTHSFINLFIHSLRPSPQAFSLQRLRMVLEEIAASSPGIVARSFLHRHLVVMREGGREGRREGPKNFHRLFFFSADGLTTFLFVIERSLTLPPSLPPSLPPLLHLSERRR